MRLLWFMTFFLSALTVLGTGCGPGGSSSVSEELMRYRSGIFSADPARITAKNYAGLLRENTDFKTETLTIRSDALAGPAWRIFEILMHDKEFQAATGAPAVSISRAGSVFLKEDALFGGAIKALTFQIDAGSEGVDIYQLWHGASPLPADHRTHAGQMSMPDDYYTLVHFEIRPIDNAQTRLSIYQHGVPGYSADHFVFGWKNFYIGSLERVLNRSK